MDYISLTELAAMETKARLRRIATQAGAEHYGGKIGDIIVRDIIPGSRPGPAAAVAKAVGATLAADSVPAPKPTRKLKKERITEKIRNYNPKAVEARTGDIFEGEKIVAIRPHNDDKVIFEFADKSKNRAFGFDEKVRVQRVVMMTATGQVVHHDNEFNDVNGKPIRRGDRVNHTFAPGLEAGIVSRVDADGTVHIVHPKNDERDSYRNAVPYGSVIIQKRGARFTGYRKTGDVLKHYQTFPEGGRPKFYFGEATHVYTEKGRNWQVLFNKYGAEVLRRDRNGQWHPMDSKTTAKGADSSAVAKLGMDLLSDAKDAFESARFVRTKRDRLGEDATPTIPTRFQGQRPEDLDKPIRAVAAPKGVVRARTVRAILRVSGPNTKLGAVIHPVLVADIKSRGTDKMGFELDEKNQLHVYNVDFADRNFARLIKEAAARNDKVAVRGFTALREKLPKKKK